MSFGQDTEEDRGAGFKPLINVVPLIGVLAAVMVVMMMAMPGRSASFDYDVPGGCFMCIGERCDAYQRIELRVHASGSVGFEGHEMSLPELRKSLRVSPGSPETKDFKVDLRTDADADYSDMMRVVAILKELGLEDRNINVKQTDD